MNPPEALPSVQLLTGMWLIFKGHDKADELRRSARSTRDRAKRQLKLKAAEVLDWGAEHPFEAGGVVERIVQRLRRCPVDTSIRW